MKSYVILELCHEVLNFPLLVMKNILKDIFTCCVMDEQGGYSPGTTLQEKGGWEVVIYWESKVENTSRASLA